MKKLETTDVFALIRLIEKTGVRQELESQVIALAEGRKEIKDFSASDGIGLIFALISAFGNAGAEDAFYEFLAVPFEMTPDEIKHLPPQDTLDMIMQIASLDEWRRFFSYAGGLLRQFRARRS